ncbi:MAG: isocitrate/isopropylmalate dehydrogenase family protein [Pseudomonadota bacterium]
MAAVMSPIRLLSLAGDGIGPEIMAATLAVLDALRPSMGRSVEVTEMEIGFAALAAEGTTLPPAVLDTARAADGVLLGPVSHNEYPAREAGGVNPSGELRKALDLHANIRPARTWPGIDAPLGTPLDLIVVRENLEGFYADRNMHLGPGEVMPVPGVALALRRITEAASRKIAETAFAIAAERPKQRVAAVHKANVMRVTDGLFLDTVREVAAQFPQIAYEEILVDAAAAHLVRNPARFDVLVTTNMFGDILSDLASELAGGLGLAASLNAGLHHTAAQAQHGSAPDIAGQDRANPVSMILSLGMLLRHLGERTAADTLDAALGAALARPPTRTADLGGALGTRAFADHLIGILSGGQS